VQGLRALTDYDAIVFDCDGVLLDSNLLKIESFRSTLRAHAFDDATVEAFSKFQTTNFGMSRHRLFDELLTGRFGSGPVVTKQILLDTFGVQTSEGYLTVAEAPKLHELLTALSAAVPLFVVSGSDEEELRLVFEKRGLTRYFREIFGSPATKLDNLRRVGQLLNKPAEPRLLFVGDAEADADAAQAYGADFLFAAKYSTVRGRMEERARQQGFDTVETISELLPWATRTQ
jgi:phosphoglycolate phosphatase-like HAD superfamily hydrolase